MQEHIIKKIFIWGAGEIGKRIMHHFDKKWEVIFVDSNEQRVNSFYCGKLIIGIDEYLEKYSSEFILIAHLHEDESIKVLQDNNIENYFIHYNLPSEFQEPYIRDNLKNHIIDYLRTREDYILYGLNLYSIIIDDWLDSQFGVHPYILMQNDISEKLADKIKRQYPGLNIVDNIREVPYVKEICVCKDNYNDVKDIQAFNGHLLTDVFDCSDNVNEYYNPVIESSKNKYSGERCFIVATGPSLRTEDLDVLKAQNIITFSVNTIFKAFKQTSWRPTYYVTDDYRAIRENSKLIESIPEIASFVGDTCKLFWDESHSEKIIKYHKHYEYFGDRLPKFTEDFSRKSYTGLTVTYTCIQLAAYMGFTEIYLLGVDCNYINNSRNNYFFQSDKKDSFDHQVDKTVLAYKAARKYADAHGIKIYNATRGGMLEVFERVDFDSLFPG